ncbi:capsular polysaccharide synthesis protein [Loigolactobacillus binensis]|uniref:Capsular polysaccharide synthesis protein n=1 Tax=Loigolactobacillus binensis TaxID=2559922 RepID=A0ABW3EDG2_9LACO|nr:capsular polysaccharide synthesis protein [Loigolactobacillus binensis]
MNIRRKKVINTIYSYFRAGKLPLMLGLLPFSLGKDRVGLEIFRERLNLGIQRTLKRKFFKREISDNFNSATLKIVPNNMIWFMWLQGIENAPDFCKANFNYLKRKFPNLVNLITEENIFDYIDIPEYIKLKWKNGKISNTHFSDIVRVQLLCTYGGTWIDSTVIVKKDFILNLPEFQIPQTYGPGRSGHSIPVSNWFIHAENNNEFLLRVRDMLFKYWEENDRAIDYFIFHHFMIIVSHEMSDYLDSVPPLDNTLPHFLMLKMRHSSLHKSELASYLDKFEMMKFTNKFENSREAINYEKLTQLLTTLN